MESMTIPKHDPPPYASGDASEQDDFLDRVMAHGHAERESFFRNGANPELSREIERIRGLVIFALSMDYQRNKRASLSAEDREHFLAMDNTLHDLFRAQTSTRPTYAERQTLAPYFWRYLHEPCHALNIPVECVLDIMRRMFQFLNGWGRYKGCCFSILHAYGLRTLARKLYMDQAILIPRLVKDKRVRRELSQGIADIRSLYFDQITGFEGSTMASDNNGRGWSDHQDVIYAPNQRGKDYDYHRHASNLRRDVTLSSGTWTAKVRKCAKGVVERHQKVRVGERAPDGEMNWKDQIIPVGRRVPYHFRSIPSSWTWKTTSHLPDFNENRTYRIDKLNGSTEA